MSAMMTNNLPIPVRLSLALSLSSSIDITSQSLIPHVYHWILTFLVLDKRFEEEKIIWWI